MTINVLCVKYVTFAWIYLIHIKLCINLPDERNVITPPKLHVHKMLI